MQSRALATLRGGYTELTLSAYLSIELSVSIGRVVEAKGCEMSPVSPSSVEDLKLMVLSRASRGCESIKYSLY